MKNERKFDKKNVEDILALTAMQESMLFQYIKDPFGDLYFEQACYKIEGDLNRQCFEEAWKYVIEFNQMLRTCFVWERISHPLQIILKSIENPVSCHDYSKLETTNSEKFIEKVCRDDRNEKFNLSKGCFRVRLYTLSKNENYMIISNHHIISDGWSNAIILNEFLEFYNCLYVGKNIIKPRKSSYSYYIKWLQSQNTKEHKEYWTRYLKGFKTPNKLPLNKSALHTTSCVEYYEYEMEEVTVDEIKSYIKEKSVTLAAVLYAAWGILLHMSSGCSDILFGVTVSGRPTDIKDMDTVVGLFINTVPLRLKIEPDSDIDKLIEDICRELPGRMELNSTPLRDIISCSEMSDGTPLFNTVVVVQNYPVYNLLKKNSAIRLKLHSRFYTTQIPLSLGVRAFDGIILDFAYDSGVYNQQNITKIKNAFIKIIVTITGKRKYPNDKIYVKDIENIDLCESNRSISDIRNTKKALEFFEKVGFDDSF